MATPDFSVIFASLASVRGVMKQFEQTPLKSALMDLHGHIFDIQNVAAQLQQQLHEAQQRVRDLELAQRDPTEGLTCERGVFWLGDLRDHGSEGPFCGRCLQADRLRLTMSQGSDGSATCPNCKTHIYSVWPDLARNYAVRARAANEAALARARGRFGAY